MDIQTISELNEFFSDFDYEIEEASIHGNTAEDQLEMKFFKNEEREEWYDHSHQWHYVGDAVVLIRRVDPRTWSVGWNNANSDPYYIADIWGD